MKVFRPLKQFLLLFAGLLGLAGCSQMKASNFAGASPRFLPEQFFLGEGKAHGVFFDRFNNLKRSFVLTLRGRSEGGEFVIAEDLRYDDGREIQREYRLKKLDEHRYEVRSEAFEGLGTIESYGNVLNWNYVLKEEIGGEIWHLTFDDWMFLQEDGVVLNRAYGTKFGFDIGEVFLTFR
ncbi:MAG: DUF3833 family protein, partial [Bdellovibrionales bacterium]|nr:DUF3833 family protein [Bdellovibrionales bacterium]